MSEHDNASSEWQLGMTLPSRKETHGRKKKEQAKGNRQVPAQSNEPVRRNAGKTPVAASMSTESLETAAREEVLQAMQQTAATAAWMAESPQQVQEVVTPPADHRSADSMREVDDCLVDDENYLRDLINNTQPIPPVATATAVAPAPEAAANADVDAEEDAPVIAKWKLAMLILLAPIVLVVVLAWGKLAYVHHVPNFVRQQVPDYQTGAGFLIIKPWWFGPTVFTLDQYPLDQGEDYEHWKLQLTDYEAVVQSPDVLYTFQQDILQQK